MSGDQVTFGVDGGHAARVQNAEQLKAVAQAAASKMWIECHPKGKLNCTNTRSAYSEVARTLELASGAFPELDRVLLAEAVEVDLLQRKLDSVHTVAPPGHQLDAVTRRALAKLNQSPDGRILDNLIVSSSQETSMQLLLDQLKLPNRYTNR